MSTHAGSLFDFLGGSLDPLEQINHEPPCLPDWRITDCYLELSEGDQAARVAISEGRS